VWSILHGEHRDRLKKRIQGRSRRDRPSRGKSANPKERGTGHEAVSKQGGPLTDLQWRKRTEKVEEQKEEQSPAKRAKFAKKQTKKEKALLD